MSYNSEYYIIINQIKSHEIKIKEKIIEKKEEDK